MVVEWPEWGEWSFIPFNGTGLTPEDNAVTVIVHVVAPPEKSEYNGTIKIINGDDTGDYETIPVYMKTPVDLFSVKYQFLSLLGNLIHRFSLFQHLMKLMT